MNILYEGTDPRSQKNPDDEQRARIKAKLDLWYFLDEMIEELLTTYLNETELAQELISASIWILHPHYTGIEILREAHTVLKSLKLKVPENYHGKFADSFQRIIITKLQGQAMRHQRKK